MNTLTSLKCTAVLLPALALSMPMANAQDEKHDDPQDSTKTSASYGSNPQNERSAQATADNEFFENMPVRGYHSDSLVGQEVESRSNNESVGEISNLLLDENGHIVAVIVSVGGTLGMGERDVAIAWDQIERRVDGDETTLLVNQTKENLKDAPKYSSQTKSDSQTAFSSGDKKRTDQDKKRHDYDEEAKRSEQRETASTKSSANKSDKNKSDEKKAMAYKSDENKSDDNKSFGNDSSDMDKSDANEVAHSQFLAAMPASGYHSDNLVGQEVTNRSDDESIGEVSDLVLDENGQVMALIVSVGGVLGLGERDVAISWDQVERKTDGEETTLSVDFDEDSLKDAPKYTRDQNKSRQ